MLGKIESQRRGLQRVRRLDSMTDSMDTELEQTLGDFGGQETLACCSPWGCKRLDTT